DLAPLDAKRPENDLERARPALYGDGEARADHPGERGLKGLAILAKGQRAGTEGVVNTRQNLAAVLCRDDASCSWDGIHFSLLALGWWAAPASANCRFFFGPLALLNQDSRPRDGAAAQTTGGARGALRGSKAVAASSSSPGKTGTTTTSGRIGSLSRCP